MFFKESCCYGICCLGGTAVCKFFDPGAKRATVMGYVVMERQVCISFLDQGPRGLLLWDMLSWRDRYVLVFWTRGQEGYCYGICCHGETGMY
jgi:hypothetical protein